MFERDPNPWLEKGLGDAQYTFAVYIANTPPLTEYHQLSQIQAVVSGEIHAIGQSCGNGWRKVFNVYAKLVFAIDKNKFDYSRSSPTWQHYRDQCLLQSGSRTALIFGSPVNITDHRPIRIICGKTHGLKSFNDYHFEWQDAYFAVCHEQRMIVCPYFDYRQLTNERIERLARFIENIKRG